MNCTVVDGSEPVHYNWYHNDSLINITAQQRISKNMDQPPQYMHSTLIVTSAQRDDGGEYYCEAVFADSNETSNRVTLQIQGETAYMHACSGDH